jgi:hypothetical protein
LIMDDYSSHKTLAVMTAIKNTGSFVSILPGGSTSQIKVLDVGVNKPLKDKFRSKWVDWMAYENRENTEVITRVMLANWLHIIWDQIDASRIPKTWNTCGYMNYGY